MKLKKEEKEAAVMILILVAVAIIGYIAGFYEGKSYYFDEDKAVEMIEHKMRNPEELFRFELLLGPNLTIQESINRYFLFGYGANTCLRMELRKICLNSEKS